MLVVVPCRVAVLLRSTPNEPLLPAGVEPSAADLHNKQLLPVAPVNAVGALVPLVPARPLPVAEFDLAHWHWRSTAMGVSARFNRMTNNASRAAGH